MFQFGLTAYRNTTEEEIKKYNEAVTNLILERDQIHGKSYELLQSMHDYIKRSNDIVFRIMHSDIYVNNCAVYERFEVYENHNQRKLSEFEQLLSKKKNELFIIESNLNVIRKQYDKINEGVWGYKNLYKPEFEKPESSISRSPSLYGNTLSQCQYKYKFNPDIPPPSFN